MTAFFISTLYCIIILCVTYLFIHNKFKFQLTKIIAFGSGFLSIFVVIEILPHTLKESSNLFISLSLILFGFILNATTERWILPKLKFLNHLLQKNKHKYSEHDTVYTHYRLMPSSMGCSAMGCFILCAFFDGIRLNSGLLINPQATVMISLGLLFHLLPESITILGIGFSSGFSRKTLLYIISLFCLSFMAGSVSFFALSTVEVIEQSSLAIASGLFIYVCSIHLIPATIKTKQVKWFFIGVSMCLFLNLLSHLIPFHGPIGIH